MNHFNTRLLARLAVALFSATAASPSLAQEPAASQSRDLERQQPLAQATPSAATSALPAHPTGIDWDKPSVTFGLGIVQTLVGGANVQVDFRYKHLIIDYSHGWGLTLPSSTLGGDMEKQRVSLRIPYTTGLGIGASFPLRSLYSIVDLRFEPKLHRFEASFNSADGSQRTQFASYNTVTLGAGAYWTLVPFQRRHDALRGLSLSTSLRYWPNVASTLNDNQVAYANSVTGQNEVHRAANIGISNTPVIVNVSVGYVFQ